MCTRLEGCQPLNFPPKKPFRYNKSLGKNMKLKIINFRTWFWWVAVHGLSVLFTYLLFLIVRQIFCSVVDCDLGTINARLLSFISWGIILASLRRRVIGDLVSLNVRWIVATGLGMVMTFVPFIFFTAIAGSLMGLIIGLAQWSGLRNKVSESKFWVLSNMLGYSLGFTALQWMLWPDFHYFDWLNPTLSRSQESIVFAILALLIPAAITGFFLSLLLRKPTTTSSPQPQPTNP